MATVEKINKPDYRVTLSSDEKEALQKFLGDHSSGDRTDHGLSDYESRQVKDLYYTLERD